MFKNKKGLVSVKKMVAYPTHATISVKTSKKSNKIYHKIKTYNQRLQSFITNLEAIVLKTRKQNAILMPDTCIFLQLPSRHLKDYYEHPEIYDASKHLLDKYLEKLEQLGDYKYVLITQGVKQELGDFRNTFKEVLIKDYYGGVETFFKDWLSIVETVFKNSEAYSSKILDFIEKQQPNQESNTSLTIEDILNEDETIATIDALQRDIEQNPDLKPRLDRWGKVDRELVFTALKSIVLELKPTTIITSDHHLLSIGLAVKRFGERYLNIVRQDLNSLELTVKHSLRIYVLEPSKKFFGVGKDQASYNHIMRVYGNRNNGKKTYAFFKLKLF